MPDTEENQYCIWCSSPIISKYKGKLFCDKSYCHTAFHYHRTRHYSPLTPKQFKYFILKALESETHPNPHHPIHTLKEEIEDIKNNAINLKEVLTRKELLENEQPTTTIQRKSLQMRAKTDANREAESHCERIREHKSHPPVESNDRWALEGFGIR